MTARLVGMCGLAFAGKTTLARAIVRVVGAEYIALDDINEERGLRGGDGVPPHEWDKTSFIAIERMQPLLRAGRDVVLDDTLCFRWLRDRYVAVAERCGARFVLVHVVTPLSEIHEAMRRNDASGERLPIRAEIFEGLQHTFELPTPDEQAHVYERGVPADEWIARHLVEP